MKGIIMTTESVRAIHDGRKTMTRRAIEPQPDFAQHHVHKGKLLYECDNRTWCWKNHISPDCWNEIDWLEQFAPYQPGDILYVKEVCRISDPHGDCTRGDRTAHVTYKAGGDQVIALPSDAWLSPRWRSPIFMPRAAARIFLRVTDVRVERLQEINDEDAQDEGIEPREPNHVVGARYRFGQPWNSINGKRKGGIYAWERNPFCWVYSYESIGKDEAMKHEDGDHGA